MRQYGKVIRTSGDSWRHSRDKSGVTRQGKQNKIKINTETKTQTSLRQKGKQTETWLTSQDKTKPGEETKGTGQAITKWKDNKQTHEQTKYKELTEEEGDTVKF